MDAAALEAAFGFSRFDLAVGRDSFTSGLLAAGDSIPRLSASLVDMGRALPGATMLIAQTLFREGARVSELFAKGLRPDLAARLLDFEDGFYARRDLSSLGMDRKDLKAALVESGLEFEVTIRRESYPRRLARSRIESWLSPPSPYGSALAELFAAGDIAAIAEAMAADGASVDWPISVLYAKLRLPT